MDMTNYAGDTYGFVDYFHDTHGERVKYCPKNSRAYIFDGKVWRMSGKDCLELRSVVQAECRNISENGIGATADELRKLGGGARKISDLAMSVRADKRFWVDLSDFDDEPYLFNTQNGTFDIRTGKLRPHAADDMLTGISPYSYVKSNPEKYIGELGRLFGDAKYAASYMQALSLSVFGVAAKQKIVILYSLTGGNGKDSVLNAVRVVLGKDYATMVSSDLVCDVRYHHDSEKTKLVGKRMGMLTEVEDSKLDKDRLKKVVGSEVMDVRYMGMESQDVPIRHNLYLANNGLPEVKEVDSGLHRRLWLFPVDAPEILEPDDMFVQKMVADEGDEILSLLLRQAAKVQRAGITVHPLSTDALDNYRIESDTFGEFLAEHTRFDDDDWADAKELFSAYRDEHPKGMGKHAFNGRMRALPGVSYESQRNRWKGIAKVYPAPAGIG